MLNNIVIHRRCGHQIRNCSALKEAAGNIVIVFPHRECAAFGCPQTGFSGPRQTGNRCQIAFGGLETAFCWVLVGGLFWKRANKMGALLSMGGGVAAYCVAMALGFKLFGLHQITIGITVALVLMVVGSLASKPTDKAALEAFFPED